MKLPFLIATCLACALPVAAQAPRGPLPPPSSSQDSSSPSYSSAPPPRIVRSSQQGDEFHRGDSAIDPQPPSVPVDQIIQRFAEHESEFKKERDNYTYEQSFVMQTIDADGQPDGEYRMDSDILFTPEGKRYEEVTYAPVPTLERIQMSEQDLDDLKNIQPFVLTTEELPKYNITYVGRQHVDEIAAYVFDVAPKTVEKHQRYFQGRIWVDQKDLEIVKSFGKAVPDIINKDNRYYSDKTDAVVYGRNENIFPHFETYRQNIAGPFWFPTYTHSDDVLNFSTGPVRIRFTVRYSNYKKFGSTVKIGTPVEIKEPQPESQSPPQKQPPPTQPQAQSQPQQQPQSQQQPNSQLPTSEPPPWPKPPA
jgi:hypothetical protein